MHLISLSSKKYEHKNHSIFPVSFRKIILPLIYERKTGLHIKFYLITLWSILDPIYFLCTRLIYLNDNKGSKSNILRVRLTRYKGIKTILSDGTMIQKNDLLIKIHLHNAQLIKNISNIQSDVRKAMIIHQSVKNSLPQLAAYISQHPDHTDIKGVVGITMLNRGSSKLGFESVKISSPIYKYVKFFTLLPIYWLSVQSFSLHHLKKHTPCYVFMSKEQLVKKYSNSK